MKRNLDYQPPRKAVIQRADQIPMRPLDVVLPNILFRKKVTLLAGPPASGKGAIEVAIAARISRGGNHPSWPDPTHSTQGKALFLTGNEDNPEDTVIARLKAAGADMSRIFFFREMRSDLNCHYRPSFRPPIPDDFPCMPLIRNTACNLV